MGGEHVGSARQFAVVGSHSACGRFSNCYRYTADYSNSSNIEVPEDGRVAVETLVREAGVRLQGDEEMAGWQGGRVWLVPTDLKIDEWKPVAERTLH